MNTPPEVARSPLRITPAGPDDAELIVSLVRELAEFERLLARGQDPARRHPSRPVRPAPLRGGGHRLGWRHAGRFCALVSQLLDVRGSAGVVPRRPVRPRPRFGATGYGEALLKHLAALALDRGCGRFEWSVLDWNEKAIGFYERLGAVPMNDWTVYRVAGPALRRLAGFPA